MYKVRVLSRACAAELGRTGATSQLVTFATLEQRWSQGSHVQIMDAAGLWARLASAPAGRLALVEPSWKGSAKKAPVFSYAPASKSYKHFAHFLRLSPP